MSKLTEFEKETHQKLHEYGKLYWYATTTQQTRALNRLIKKGFATYDGEKREWRPV